MWTRAVSLRLALNLVLCRPNRANDFWGSWDHFGGSWRHFGSSWGNVNFGDSWKGLGASLGGLRVTLGALGTIEEPWDVLGRLWGGQGPNNIVASINLNGDKPHDRFHQ